MFEIVGRKCTAICYATVVEDEAVELIRTYKEQGRRNEIQQALKELKWKQETLQPDMPDDLCYLSGKYLERYLQDVEICQRFARRNREKMAEILLDRTGITAGEVFHTIHNYIDTEERILRKAWKRIVRR